MHAQRTLLPQTAASVSPGWTAPPSRCGAAPTPPLLRVLRCAVLCGATPVMSPALSAHCSWGQSFRWPCPSLELHSTCW